MKTFYVGLCRSLVGYYIKVHAPNEDILRDHLFKYYGQMWCSIYDEETWNTIKENLKHYNVFAEITLKCAEWE